MPTPTAMLRSLETALLAAARAGLVVTLAVLATGCWRAAAWDLNNPAGRGDTIHCEEQSRPAERRRDGVAVCPWGAAFDGSSLGRVDDAGHYTADVRIRPSPFYMDFCQSVALAGYPDEERLSRALVTWSADPGDSTSRWGPILELMVGRVYVDCDDERVYYTDYAHCFVVGRDRTPRAIACAPEIFLAVDEWSFVTSNVESESPPLDRAEPTELESASAPIEPENLDAPRPAPEESCTSALECTLVTDGCGRPHGARLGHEPAFLEGRICPPEERRASEPACAGGRCERADAALPELRECSADSDCVALPGLCGTWTAAHRARRAEMARDVARREGMVDCAAGPREPRPAAGCLLGVCVARRELD